MAKATILICDWCKTQEPASGTLTLRNGSGKRGGIRKDLCKRHIVEITRFFERGGVRVVPTERPAAKPKRGAWNKADYETINRKIMELADARPMFTGADVAKFAKVSTHIGKYAVRRLIGAGKIVATGQGAGRKLSKA